MTMNDNINEGQPQDEQQKMWNLYFLHHKLFNSFY